jgi:Ca2+-binding EF-hand superfamily protein
MADTLPGDLVATYQDAFQHFDTTLTGFISTKQLGPLLRFCAENPSEAEIQVRFLIGMIGNLCFDIVAKNYKT